MIEGTSTGIESLEGVSTGSGRVEARDDRGDCALAGGFANLVGMIKSEQDVPGPNSK